MRVIKERQLEWNRHFVVRQEKQAYMQHDRLFKKLIGEFFEEFLEVFFPNIHAHIDFGKITPSSEEIFAEMYDGDKKLLDIVLEMKWKDTAPVIVVHIEHQSTKQRDFNKPMFRYFSSLYNKYGKPIIPIAIFSYEEDWEENKFEMDFAGVEV